MLRQRGASWVVVFDEDFGLPADREPRLKAQGCTTNLARCFFGRQGYVIWDGYWNEPAEPFVYSAHGESLQIKQARWQPPLRSAGVPVPTKLSLEERAWHRACATNKNRRGLFGYVVAGRY